MLDDFFSLEGFAHRSLWQEGKPVWFPLQGLKEYFQAFSFQIAIAIPKNVYLIHPELISIGEGVVLEPGVCIEGPCVLGRGCQIRHGAFLRAGVICGEACVVGHCAEVKHSILLDGARATHFTYVGDSILGRDVNLGAGVKCANVRLDGKEIRGLPKMGAIVGDGTQVGCNAVLNPGVLIKKGSRILPLTMVTKGDIAETTLSH